VLQKEQKVCEYAAKHFIMMMHCIIYSLIALCLNKN